MSGTSKAVFLSYASQDAGAVARLAGALRAAGIEVWFDQDELRGGDAWDQKIRRQIRECALFVPVVSANTQARPEGYFRLEWHLAEQRSQLIARGRPFIVPVVAGDIDERDALVPEAFLAVQWTRLPLGAKAGATADGSLARFAERVGQLLQSLSGPVTPSAGARSRPTGSRAPAAERGLADVGPPVPDYELLRMIGSGSYGDVWLARGVTGIHRAVKVVWRERFEDAEPFEREFRGLTEFAAFSVKAEGQMGLLHIGRNDAAGFFYYVMELADDANGGRTFDPEKYVPLTLKEWRQRKGRVPAAEVIAAGAELAAGLAALHGRGLVHRDIKPSNAILVNGRAKLADIGLVTAADDARTFIGTAGYVPPEGPGSPAADVFALGRVLYELATGLDRDEFPKLPADLERLPDRRELLALNDVILRACAPSPEKRYRDAGELLADLEKLRAGRRVRRGRFDWKLAVQAAAVVVGLGAVAWRWWPQPAPAAEAAGPAPVATPAPAAPAVPAPAPEIPTKSIAVLPFANLSSDQSNAYFADGVHEDVLAKLSSIPELRVVSRTTVMAYRDTKKTAKDIGRELGVAYLLEGSVRREGGQVRVTGQLVDARTDRQVRPLNYTRNLADIFALQSDLAQTIAVELSAVLSPETKAVLERPLTTVTAAYEEYLRGRALLNSGPSTANRDKAEVAFRRAVELDPGFAAAWGALAEVHSSAIFQATDTSAERKAKADEAMAQALRLAPDSLEVQRAHGSYLYQRFRDFNRATEVFEGLRRRLPNDGTAYYWLGVIQRRNLRWAESTANLRRATELDPANGTYSAALGQSLSGMRRFPELLAENHRRIAVLDNDPEQAERVAIGLSFRTDPSRAETDRRLAQLSEKQNRHPAVIRFRRLRAYERRDLAEYRRLDEELVKAEPAAASDAEAAFHYAVLGDPETARKRLGDTAERLREQLAKTPDRAFSWAELGRIEALRGNRVEAMRCARKAAEAMPESLDAYFGPQVSRQIAEIYAWCGEKDRALAELQRLEQNPGSYMAAGTMAKWVPWAPLEDDPRFQALIEQMKRNTPLTGEVSPGMLTAPPLPDPALLAEPVGVPFTLPGRVVGGAATGAAVAVPATPVFRVPGTTREPAAADPAAAADTPSLAVLPFANLGGDKEQEWFADGLTEEILDRLARERGMRVVGRASSFSFKDRKVAAPEIARALGVTQLVEGSIQRAGPRVRIRVQLTRGADGASESLGSFDRELADVFALQDEVAAAVVARMTGRAAAAAPAAAMPTRNVEAYDAYLRGRALKAQSAVNAADAEKLFARAVELDPDFALAWARLAGAFGRQVAVTPRDEARLLVEEEKALTRALALKPDLPEALIVRADWLRYGKSDYAGAARDLARAESLAPPTAELRITQANLARDRGDWPEAVRLMREGLALDPQNGDIVNGVAATIGYRGLFSEADGLLARAVVLQGGASQVPFRNRLSNRQAWRGSAAAARLLDRSPAPGDENDRRFREFTKRLMLGQQAEARALAGEIERMADGLVAANPRANVNRLPPDLLEAAGWTDLAHRRRTEGQAARVARFEAGERTPAMMRILVLAELAAGRRDQALAFLRAWRTAAEVRPSLWQRLKHFEGGAACYARLGLADEAIRLLQEYADAGYRRGPLPRQQRHEYAALEADPRFRELQRQELEWALGQPDPEDDLLATAAAFRAEMEAEWAAAGPAAGGAVPVMFRLPGTGAAPAAAAAPAGPMTIAVLPFTNLSGDPAQEYFSDGLTEEILDALARERDLRVAARTSAFSFKGRQAAAAEVARALNVALLVEGSVRKAGSRVRIAVRLTRADDGYSEALGSFDRELADIFALQEEVARSVVAKVTGRNQVRAAAAHTRNPEAYDAYLRGRELQVRSGNNAAEAAQHFERAVALDPGFALAWARLAEARFRNYGGMVDRSPGLVAAARLAIDRALDAQPDLPEGLLARANWTRLVAGDLTAAQRDLDRVESLGPPRAELRWMQALLARDAGEWPRAQQLAREAIELDPQNGDISNGAGLGFFSARGEFAEADRLYARAMAIQGPTVLFPFRNRVILRAAWRGDEAALRLVERAPEGQVGVELVRAGVLARLGRKAEARALVEAVERKVAPAAAGSTAVAAGRSDTPVALLLAVGMGEEAKRRAAELRADALRNVERGNLAPLIRSDLVLAEIALGHRAEARRLLEEWRRDADRLTSASRRFQEYGQFAVQHCARLGLADEAVALLREMEAQGLQPVFSMNPAVDWSPIAGDERFQAVMRRAREVAAAQPDPEDDPRATAAAFRAEGERTREAK